MPTKIKKLRVNEVSLVPRPANQHASVPLFKADDAPTEKGDKAAWKPCSDCMTEKACRKEGACRMEKAADPIEKCMSAKRMARLKRKKMQKGGDALPGYAQEVADLFVEFAKGEPAETQSDIATAVIDEIAKATKTFADLIDEKAFRAEVLTAIQVLRDACESAFWSTAPGEDAVDVVAQNMREFAEYITELLAEEEDEETSDVGKDAAAGGDRAGGSSDEANEEDMTKNAKDGAPAETNAGVDINKAVEEAVSKAVAGLAEENKALRDRLAKAEEVEANRAAEALAKGMLDGIPGDAAKLASVLKGLSEEKVAALREVFTAIGKQRETVAAFQTFGKSSAAEPKPEAEEGVTALNKAMDERAARLKKSAA